MFLIEANRYIYQSMDYLFHKKQEITPTAIMEVMKDTHMRKVVEDYGGLEYLTILSESRVSQKNLDIFCEKLKQAYTRTKLVEISEDVSDIIMSDKAETYNPQELVSLFEEELSKLQNDTLQTSEVYKIGSDASEVLKIRAENPNTVPGIEIGMPIFDYYTNGGQAGDLFVVCARAKCGKSALLTNWATQLSIIEKIPVLYFDTEMSAREQEDRILSILSGVPHKEIVSGMYVLDTEFGKAEEKRSKLNDAIKMLNEGEYYHIYMPTFTIEKVNAISRKMKIQNGIQAIFFDYLKMPSSAIGSLKNAQEYQMLGYITSGMKDLAGTLGIPIYSACQENRSNLDGKKDERNIGGSDRILQLATKLMFLSRKSDEEIMKGGGAKLCGNRRLEIVYQRNGQSNAPPIDLFFDEGKLKFNEI